MTIVGCYVLGYGSAEGPLYTGGNDRFSRNSSFLGYVAAGGGWRHARRETINFRKIKFPSAMRCEWGLYTRGKTLDFQKIKFSSAMGVRGGLVQGGKRSIFKK